MKLVGRLELLLALLVVVAVHLALRQRLVDHVGLELVQVLDKVLNDLNLGDASVLNAHGLLVSRLDSYLLASLAYLDSSII